MFLNEWMNDQKLKGSAWFLESRLYSRGNREPPWVFEWRNNMTSVGHGPCGPCNISITWVLMRTRESEVRPQTRQIRTCTSSRCPGDLSVHFISRRAALESSLCWKRKKVVFLKIPIRKETKREEKRGGKEERQKREKGNNNSHKWNGHTSFSQTAFFHPSPVLWKKQHL